MRPNQRISKKMESLVTNHAVSYNLTVRHCVAPIIGVLRGLISELVLDYAVSTNILLVLWFLNLLSIICLRTHEIGTLTKHGMLIDYCNIHTHNTANDGIVVDQKMNIML